ncbi:hypothetical protein [Nesterenkonia sphaerica]|uniref:Uncharacterized protein n=1 Tax=Nesterenkonia sphaerica TaxID=1804988 RepID=A0A5R9ACF9_9MICC|nr:hypothetical protein [Nesterenkonia sphaerica]TLP75537.1 hypothetical protein FEF27_07735 [Nesterenkonia sphaerica]
MMMHRWNTQHRLPRTAALLVVAALTLSGCTSAAQGTEAESAEPAVPDAREAEVTPAPQPPGPSPTPGTASISGAVPVQSAELGQAERAPAPTRVTYPGIDADIRVHAHGVSADGQMEIPDDAAVAAWYQYGSAPADETGGSGSVPT